MSRRGNCWDNAPQESFFAHFKDEVDLKSYRSIDDVKDKIDSLSKPILNLGVSIRVVDEPLAKQLNLEEGLYVVEVNEYSPAEKAGLKSGDLIVKADGTRIKTFEELQEIKNSKEEGDTINIEFIRDGKTKNTTITLTSTSSTSSSESTTN